MPGTPNSIITPQTPKAANAVCTAANTNYSAPTAVVLLATAGANGARLTKLTAVPRTTVTATQLQLFSSPDGATFTLVDSALMKAYPLDQVTEIPTTDFLYSDAAPLVLGGNERLYVAIGVALAQGIAFRAEWADY